MNIWSFRIVVANPFFLADTFGIANNNDINVATDIDLIYKNSESDFQNYIWNPILFEMFKKTLLLLVG